jgi:hypothetical protein
MVVVDAAQDTIARVLDGDDDGCGGGGMFPCGSGKAMGKRERTAALEMTGKAVAVLR